MKKYKIVSNGYVVCVGKSKFGTAIPETEYNAILDLIHNKPIAPEGYDYRLRADTLEWELVELPPMPDPEDDELTAEEALEIISGGAE